MGASGLFLERPVLLIRAEAHRVLFGFWRGQRLRDLEPALQGGGKYEMATIELREGMSIADGKVKQLVRAAVALDASLGDPTAITKDVAIKAKRKVAPKKRASRK